MSPAGEWGRAPHRPPATSHGFVDKLSLPIRQALFFYPSMMCATLCADKIRSTGKNMGR